ncbi:MAG: DUF2157 domain-containing protein [Xanthomonadales bacterium]|nr:DUF2157 domain-containing protein [Xanthomonadales bacterium]
MAQQHDVDASPAARQLSWGMRIASLCGGLALSAALYFFFLQVWGGLATAVKVVLLVAAPVLAVLGAAFAARRERSLYFTSLLALVAVAAFVLGLWLLADIFNRTPSPAAFLVWAVFAGLLAYAWGLRLILAVALGFLAVWLAAMAGGWAGRDWLAFGDTPETFLFAGLVLALAGGWHPPRPAGFASLWTGWGLALLLAVALLLSVWGQASSLPLPVARIELAYQIAGLLLAAATLWLGIHRDWSAVANLGVGFLVLNLYVRFFEWWWDWLPRALFFLILGLVSVAVLVLLMRLRRRRTGDAR